MKRARFTEQHLLRTGTWENWLKCVRAKWGEATYELTEIWRSLARQPPRQGLQPTYKLVRVPSGMYLVDETHDLVLVYINDVDKQFIWYDGDAMFVWTDWRYMGRWPWQSGRHSNVLDVIPVVIWKEIVQHFGCRSEIIRAARRPVCKKWMAMWMHAVYFAPRWQSWYMQTIPEVYKTHFPTQNYLLLLHSELNSLEIWVTARGANWRQSLTKNKFYPLDLYAKRMGTSIRGKRGADFFVLAKSRFVFMIPSMAFSPHFQIVQNENKLVADVPISARSLLDTTWSLALKETIAQDK